MRVPLRWLARYVELDRDATELAELLHASGTEVEAIHQVGEQWRALRVAEILRIEKHPNADRLNLATVNTGAEVLTVVCGAPNIAAGQKVPFAPVGSVIQGEVLQARPIRGIRSEGMLCAADELGLSNDHAGILILDPEEVPGRSMAEALGDRVLELDVKPTRGDCLAVIGVAREVAALTGKALKLPELSRPEESGEPIGSQFRLRIDAPDLCSRFVARLIRGVRIGPSPWWMQSLLNAAGVRAINNVVDVTNFIMLEWGKPIHAYDFAALRGSEIRVRRAVEGERTTTLDGVERILRPDMVVIADAAGGIGLGGIMGGAESEVRDSTTDILLESANFDAVALRRTATALGLHSEAVRRFERGVDPEVAATAADHACSGLALLAGGRVAPGTVEVDCREQHGPPRVRFDPAETGRLLGKMYNAEHCRRVLVSLGFDVEPGAGPEELEVTVPSWRLDVHQPADLVEEVARITGYRDLAPTLPDGEISAVAAQDPAWAARQAITSRAAEVLLGAGFNEVVNRTLLGEHSHARCVARPLGLGRSLLGSLEIAPLRLANPLAEDEQYLRTSLVPGLLATFGRNRRLGDEGLRFFETGKVFWPRSDSELPEERAVLGVLAGGTWPPRSWRTPEPTPLDFYDLKGVLEMLLAVLHVQASFEAVEHPALQPGRAAALRTKGELLGWLGQVHPSVQRQLDLPDGAILMAELDLDALTSVAGAASPRFAALGRFPDVPRQLTVSVEAGVGAAQVERALGEAGGPLLAGTRLVDVFPLAEGRVSLSYLLTFRSDERTLTDEEANAARDAAMAAVAQNLGAVQR
ncbi:MAG: phenylalanine--tRNA ligase subunit beta [Chloroflexota bacterium]